MRQPENLKTLAEEAAELRIDASVFIDVFHAVDSQRALLEKGALLQKLDAMLKRFDGVDLGQHGLLRLKNQLAGLKPQLRKLRVQTGSQQQPKTSSRQSRQERHQKNKPLNVRAQRPLAQRRPK